MKLLTLSTCLLLCACGPMSQDPRFNPPQLYSLDGFEQKDQTVHVDKGVIVIEDK